MNWQSKRKNYICKTIMGIYKKVKNKWLRGVLIALTIPFCLLLAYWLFVYLIAPRYQFTAGRPFSGSYLYNPYQNMDPDQWKQCNFHCHSRRYFGLTNGRMSKEKDIDSVYDIIRAGTLKAQETTNATLARVRKAMRINYFDDRAIIKEWDKLLKAAKQ